MIGEGLTIVEIAALGNAWPGRIGFLCPRNVVELGTGQGAAASRIMSALPAGATFTTINYADGESYGEGLADWRSDPRLNFLHLDTIDPETLLAVPDDIDILFIDTTHEAWHAATELRMWQYKLANSAIVVVDDLDQNDMASFWASLPYEKAPLAAHACQGMFRYDSVKRYVGRFDRPERTTYGGGK